MADWFDELVEDAGAQVLARQDIRSNLGKVADDRDTRNKIAAQIEELRDTGTLRELHSVRANAVEQLDRDRQMVLRELLTRQWRVVAEAEDKVKRIERQLGLAGQFAGGPPAGAILVVREEVEDFARTALDAIRRRLRPGKALEERDPRARLERELGAATDDLRQAEQDFSAAAAQESIAAHPLIRDVDEKKREARTALLDRLVDDLTGRINLIIDADLDASYRREFSYSGSAWLVDRPGMDAERLSAEINGQAFAEIRGRIDDGLTGAVGVAGPRGIGKTTLLRHFARPVPDQGPLAPWEGGGEVQRWGVSVAAPAQYDARDFLLHLFGTLCAAVLGEARVRALEDTMTGAGRDSGARLPVAWFACYLAVIALLCGAVVAALETSRPTASSRSMTDLLIAGCCAAIAVVTAVVPRRWMRFWAESALLSIEESTVLSTTDIGSFGFAERFYRLILLTMAAIVAVSGTAAAALFALVLAGRPPEPGYLAVVALAGAAVLAFLVLRWGTGVTRFVFFGRDLYRTQIRAAEDWYVKVKFQQSYTTGWSGTVTLSASPLPVQAQAGRSGSKAVSQVSMSVPEIVAAFTSFTDVLRSRPRQTRQPEAFELGGTAAGAEDAPAPAPSAPSAPIPVVVGIDEVDKIEDPQLAQAFFNQIKGLFGDANCLFLISISDDAMAAYERRGLPLRDAFDSSLSTVVALSYLTRLEARKLLGSRLVQVTEPAADLLYVLSGGLPRELVRLIRRAVDLQRDRARQTTGQEEGQQPPVPLDDLAGTLIADQVAAQRRAVLIRGRALEPCPARDGLLAWAGDPAIDAAVGVGVGQAGAPTAGAGVSAVADYFGRLVETGKRLMAACDGTVPDPQAASGSRPHADGCEAQETGAFLLWLGTVGQVFAACHDQADFQAAEQPHGLLSFERLARARQNFPLGPGYVQAAVTAVRVAWHLEPRADGAAGTTPLHAVSPAPVALGRGPVGGGGAGEHNGEDGEHGDRSQRDSQADRAGQEADRGRAEQEAGVTEG